MLFEFDKSTLTKGAKDTLGVAVRYLKDHNDVRVEIQGHTDSKGSDEYNMKLGERRAESVKAYLGTQGISGGSREHPELRRNTARGGQSDQREGQSGGTGVEPPSGDHRSTVRRCAERVRAERLRLLRPRSLLQGRAGELRWEG